MVNLVMEKYTRNVRFCLVCNYVSKIIPALQSRCTRFRFAPLAIEQMNLRLDHVVAAERFAAVNIYLQNEYHAKGQGHGVEVGQRRYETCVEYFAVYTCRFRFGRRSCRDFMHRCFSVTFILISNVYFNSVTALYRFYYSPSVNT